MGVSENMNSGFSRCNRAYIVCKHTEACLLLSRSISTIFRFSATGTQIVPEIDTQQNFEEAA
jgi:hypothetical protein